MYRRFPISTILFACFVAIVIGMCGVVATPPSALADGTQGDPPNNPPTPPDSIYDAYAPTVNSEGANRSLEGNIPLDLIVKIVIQAMVL